MKFSTLTLRVSVLFAGFTAAQDFSGLPKCAQSCALNSIPKECNLDVKCICSATSFISGITCCVSTACDAADQKSTLDFADALCGGQGVTNLPTAATCAPGQSSSPSAAASSGSGNNTAIAPQTTMPTSGTMSGSMGSGAVSSTATSVATTGASGSSAAVASGSGSSTASASASQTSSGSAALAADLMGLLGVGVFAGMAML